MVRFQLYWRLSQPRYFVQWWGDGDLWPHLRCRDAAAASINYHGHSLRVLGISRSVFPQCDMCIKQSSKTAICEACAAAEVQCRSWPGHGGSIHSLWAAHLFICLLSFLKGNKTTQSRLISTPDPIKVLIWFLTKHKLVTLTLLKGVKPLYPWDTTTLDAYLYPN